MNRPGALTSGRRTIYNVTHDLAKVGIAVVVVSSELPEVLGIADRILVMREGRSPASFPTTRPTRSRRSIWPCRPVDLLTATR